MIPTTYNNFQSLLRTFQVAPVSKILVRTMSKRSDSEHEDDIKAELERVKKNKGYFIFSSDFQGLLTYRL